MLHILVALPTTFVGLTSFKGITSNYLIIYGQAGDLAHTSRNLHTLVIASLTLTLLSQWYGYDSVDSIEESGGFQLSGHEPAHHLANLWMILVF